MTRDLRGSAMNALGWAYTSTAVRIGVQFLSGILLARMLGPEPFGIVAAAWVMVGVASQFVDCGFGSALVQRADVTVREIRFAFTLQVMLGLALCGAMAATAGVMARFLGNPAIKGVVAMLSLALLLQALGQTAASLLRRALDFRTLQLAQLAGTVIGYGAVALPMARLGYGVKSLVAGQLVQSLVTTAITYGKVRHSLIPLLDPEARSLLRFGLKATATNLVNWSIAGVDSLAMTRYFGPAAAGLFNRAQVLALVPAGQMVQVLQSVLFPAYSRRMHETAILRKVYLASLASLGIVLLPAGAVLAVTARTVVMALYGAGWEGAAGLLTPLALAMPIHCAMALSGPLLWARDRVADEFWVQSGVLVLFAVVLIVAGRMTAGSMAWGVLLVYVVRCGGMMRRALAACDANWLDCVRVVRGACGLAVVAGVAAATVDALLVGWSAGPRLASILLITVPLTIAAASVFAGFLVPDETAVLVRSCCELLPLPPVVRGLLRIPAPRAAWGDAL